MFAIIEFIIVPFIIVVVIVRRLPSLGLHTKKKAISEKVCSVIVPYDEWIRKQSGFYSFFWVSE